MGVFDWIGVAELVGLAILAVILYLAARRRAARARNDATDTAMAGAAGTAMVHAQPDNIIEFGGGGVDGGGGA